MIEEAYHEILPAQRAYLFACIAILPADGRAVESNTKPFLQLCEEDEKAPFPDFTFIREIRNQLKPGDCESQFEEYARTRRLDLIIDDLEWKNLPLILEAAHLQHLSIRYLFSDSIKDVNLSVLAPLSLESLEIMDDMLVEDGTLYGKIRVGDLSFLRGKNLKSLKLHGLMDSFNGQVLSGSEHLEQLQLAWSFEAQSVEFSGQEVLAKVSESLQQLHLHNAPVVNARYLGNLHSLKDLNLILRQQSLTLSLEREFSQLKKLRIRSSGLSNIQFVAFMPELEELDIFNNQVSDLTPATHLPRLRVLRAPSNPVEHLPSCNPESALEILHFEGLGVVKDMHPIDNCGRLKTVYAQLLVSPDFRCSLEAASPTVVRVCQKAKAFASQVSGPTSFLVWESN